MSFRDEDELYSDPSIPGIKSHSETATRGDSSFNEDCSEATFSFELHNASMITDTEYSPPCYIRGLPWKIMIIPSYNRAQLGAKSLGFFLQCNVDCELKNWSCVAVAELRLLSFNPNQEPHKRKIKHVFNAKENDWGFSYFLPWDEIADPEKGYLKNDTLIFQVHVIAEAPHGVLWDSKKHTGYVGLKNQGATCYMNSLLQTLFFTNQLRKSVYSMPTECDDASKSVALALQRVFYDLQFSDSPVGTKRLTKSFGWDTIDSFMQHDVQEFLRVLLDKIEGKMKGTSVEGSVPKLFEGKMLSYIKCKNIDLTSKRVETFYDIQLSVKGNKNIYESFKSYIATEMLDGDNKYDAGEEYSLQEAEKGVIFISFPPVLHLHLMRFQYDPVTDCSLKFNDRFEFDDELFLDSFLAEKEQTDAVYRLHAVLVHSGDNQNGHYVAYINPLLDGNWCKFDDDVVSCCTKFEAMEQNYGGSDNEVTLHDKQNSNAYMLVYIRLSEVSRVLQTIVEADIPSELIERLQEEKRIEMIRRAEKADQAIYFTIQIVMEDSFEIHDAVGYFDPNTVQYTLFRAKKTETVGSVVGAMCNYFHIPIAKMRIWPLLYRRLTTRMVYFDINSEMETTFAHIVDAAPTWTIYLETLHADSDKTIDNFNPSQHVLIFLKYFDPVQNVLNYLGCSQFILDTRLVDVTKVVKSILGLTENVELNIYEELGPNSLNKFTKTNDSLEYSLCISGVENQGYILIFEKKVLDEKLNLPTCDEYFTSLLFKVEVTFIDKSIPNDTGFSLVLSQRHTYKQMASAVAKKIDADPNKIQFFKCQSYKDLPGNPLSCSYDGHLKELLAPNKSKSSKKLFYQKILMDINDLESKRQFKCILISADYREERELTLYVDKNANIANLLEEAAKHVEFFSGSTKRLRLVEILNHKLLPIPNENTSLESLQFNNEANYADQKQLRIEEVAPDELKFESDEMLIPVSHFWKEIRNSFGNPFFIKAKNGEPFKNLQARMQKKLNIPQKEWEKYKFAFITHSKADYIFEDHILNLKDFLLDDNHGKAPLPCIGLEHVNKTNKKSNSCCLEKSIKIYN